MGRDGDDNSFPGANGGGGGGSSGLIIVRADAAAGLSGERFVEAILVRVE